MAGKTQLDRHKNDWRIRFIVIHSGLRPALVQRLCIAYGTCERIIKLIHNAEIHMH